MKEIYNYRFEYRLEGEKDFVDTSIWRHARYLEPKDAEDWTGLIKEFKDLVDLVEKGFFMNGKLEKTLFRKPMVVLNNTTDFYSSGDRITEKNFKPIEFRCVYKKENLTIKELADLLDADSFCEYLRDRGITKI
jgi:hypothetical protein